VCVCVCVCVCVRARTHMLICMYVGLDHLTNLQIMDHEITNYTVLLCLPFLSVFSPSKVKFSSMAIAQKIKQNIGINVFCGTLIENTYSDI